MKKTPKAISAASVSSAAVDTELINRYVEAIYPFFSKEFNGLFKSYCWHSNWRDESTNPGETLLNRLNMVREWRKHPRKATEEVLKWGRMRFPGNKRNLEFCKKDANAEEIVGRTCTGYSGTWGMATWTKILTIAAPEKYFIFDSRVSCALNNYCAVSKASLPYYFPNLQAKTKQGTKHPRNVAQADFIEALRKKGAKPVPGCVFLYFRLYCPLMKVLAERLHKDSGALEPLEFFSKNRLDPAVRQEDLANPKIGFDLLPHLVEMALFMKGKVK